MHKERRLCAAFIPVNNVEVTTWKPKPTSASTAITKDAALKLASGKVAHITDNTRPHSIARKAKASSDTSEDAIPVEILKRGVEYAVAVGTSGGTLAATTPGGLADVNYANSEPDKLNISPTRNDCAVVGIQNLTDGIAIVTFINTYY